MSGPAFPTLELSDPQFEQEGVRHATVYSRALGRRADCTLWAPEAGHARLPLVVLLHGVYASHWAWTRAGGAHRIAATLIGDAVIPPVALAMPSDGLFGHGSGYLDHAGGGFERWIVDEVPRVAAEVLPSVEAAAPLALIGLSMGGFGALSIGARHGDRVRAAAGMSSITDFEQMSGFVGSLDRYEGIADAERSVLETILGNRDRLPALWIDCGASDLLIDENRDLHRGLTENRIDHEWHEYDGTHDWAYWRAHLPDALTFCASRLT